MDSNRKFKQDNLKMMGALFLVALTVMQGVRFLIIESIS
jgi:hypothetical protein